MGANRWQERGDTFSYPDLLPHAARIMQGRDARVTQCAHRQPGRRIQRLGQLAAQPILGGLHHQYCRIEFSAGTTENSSCPV
jgi:hypothetical protein